MEPISLIILAVYFLMLIGIGLWFSRKQQSVNDFFLAGHSIPAWAAMAAVVATETSAVTFIGAPAMTFKEGGDMSFLQVVLGYILARVILSLYFLPKFFSHEIVTIYSYLGIRFGKKSQKISGIFFFITRALASGIRHYAAALVISSVFGYDLMTAIILTGLISFVYAALGGISAVIWTEVVQLVVMITGGLLGFYYLLQSIPGGWPEIMETAHNTGKMVMIHWDWGSDGQYSLFIGIVAGTCLSLASHGADQDLVQRLLSCKSLRSAQSAMVWSGLFVFCQFAFFLFLGIMLFTFFGALPSEITKTDEIFPYFAAQHMPPWAAGLVIAAILSAALSSTASALNSLSSTSVNDFVLTILKNPPKGKRLVMISRCFTVFWMVILIIIAILASGSDSILQTGLTIPGYTSGSLLAAFLLGIFTRFKNETALSIGMFMGVAVVLTISLCGVFWTWFVPTGALTTILTAFAIDWFYPNKERELA